VTTVGISLPELLWLYLSALLCSRTPATCVALAEALPSVSYDRLTRLLPAHWSGQTRLELAFRTLFVWSGAISSLTLRSFQIDATVIPKPCATTIEGRAWGFSSQDRRAVYGLSLGLLVWTAGTLRIPLGLRLWRKGGASKCALAVELLS
jgi:hypothetical protein